jgi:Domain of unknown function (DUF6473)
LPVQPVDIQRIATGIFMSFETIIENGLRYDTYRFGRTRQIFRGPKPDLSRPYVACIGASETYGKFVETPFPALLRQTLAMSVANWGTPDAGPAFFLRDPVMVEACSNARLCVVQIMPALNMSNRLYSVFHRRNGRLKEPSDMLQLLYPTVDFSRYSYVYNMVSRLQVTDEDKFSLVEAELRMAWVARMKELLEAIETPKILLWISQRSPDDKSGRLSPRSPGSNPALVDRSMLETIAPLADGVVEYVATEDEAQGREGDRIFTEEQEVAARRHPSATMHTLAAGALHGMIGEVLARGGPGRRPNPDITAGFGL